MENFINDKKQHVPLFNDKKCNYALTLLSGMHKINRLEGKKKTYKGTSRIPLSIVRCKLI